MAAEQLRRLKPGDFEDVPPRDRVKLEAAAAVSWETSLDATAGDGEATLLEMIGG